MGAERLTGYGAADVLGKASLALDRDGPAKRRPRKAIGGADAHAWAIQGAGPGLSIANSSVAGH